MENLENIEYKGYTIEPYEDPFTEVDAPIVYGVNIKEGNETIDFDTGYTDYDEMIAGAKSQIDLY